MERNNAVTNLHKSGIRRRRIGVTCSESTAKNASLRPARRHSGMMTSRTVEPVRSNKLLRPLAAC